MKDPTLGRNVGINNGHFAKKHSEEAKKRISDSQLKRNATLNKLLFKLREDQLNERIERICHNLLEQKLTAQNKSFNG